MVLASRILHSRLSRQPFLLARLLRPERKAARTVDRPRPRQPRLRPSQDHRRARHNGRARPRHRRNAPPRKRAKSLRLQLGLIIEVYLGGGGRWQLRGEIGQF